MRLGVLLTALSLFVLSGQAVAQQTRTYRIGFLTPAPPASMEARVGHFKQGLQELGYVEGQNIAIEFRSAEGKQERLPDLAAELITLNADVVVAHGVLATLAAKHGPRSGAGAHERLTCGRDPALRRSSWHRRRSRTRQRH